MSDERQPETAAERVDDHVVDQSVERPVEQPIERPVAGSGSRVVPAWWRAVAVALALTTAVAAVLAVLAWQRASAPPAGATAESSLTGACDLLDTMPADLGLAAQPADDAAKGEQMNRVWQLSSVTSLATLAGQLDPALAADAEIVAKPGTLAAQYFQLGPELDTAVTEARATCADRG